MDAFFDSLDRHFGLATLLGVAIFWGLRSLIRTWRGDEGDEE
jgi:hypothetical protein